MLLDKRMVKLRDKDLGILKFMFPTYEIIESVDDIPKFPTRPAIYNGNLLYLDKFVDTYNNAHLDYLVINQTSEIDLDDRRILAQVVFEKHRKGYLPKYLEEIIDSLDYDVFMENIKIKWVTGKWLVKSLDNEKTFLELVNALNKSKTEFIERYFDVVKETRPYRLEAGMMTFLQRVQNNSYEGKSFEYNKKIRMYKGEKLTKTLIAIDKALEYNIDNYELRLLNLLMMIIENGK